MVSRLEQALDRLHSRVHSSAVAGELVTYRRGGVPFSIYAMIGRPESTPPSLLGTAPGGIDLQQSNPINTDHDFWIMAADLETNGIAAPQQGDQILRTVRGVVKIHEIMAPSNGSLMYEYEDSYSKQYLVHTKFIGNG